MSPPTAVVSSTRQQGTVSMLGRSSFLVAAVTGLRSSKRNFLSACNSGILVYSLSPTSADNGSFFLSLMFLFCLFVSCFFFCFLLSPHHEVRESQRQPRLTGLTKA